MNLTIKDIRTQPTEIDYLPTWKQIICRWIGVMPEKIYNVRITFRSDITKLREGDIIVTECENNFLVTDLSALRYGAELLGPPVVKIPQVRENSFICVMSQVFEEGQQLNNI